MNVWWSGLIAAMVLFQIVSIPGLIYRRNDYADVLWGPAFPLSAIFAVIFGTVSGLQSLDSRSKILILFITIWAIRLFFHVGWRNLSKKTEDVRYNNWRKQWGEPALLRSWLQVFVLQPLILYVFLTPVLFSIDREYAELSTLTYLGIFIWIFGFLIESIADEQLRRFKMKPENKGQLMQSGLWSWSRHPNYFGEVVQWWGIWIMVIEIPGAWWTIISPLGVTYLILKVSGVSMLEDLFRTRPGYNEYVSRTSKFFLLPPKKS